jgi:NTP pyrophosphatase (non-canonical NTP hydrolase)
MGNELTRSNVMLAVLGEREKQDFKWGDQTHNSDQLWTVILTEELGEVAREVYENNPSAMFKEIIQCAAVCFAWAEAYLNRSELYDSK